MKKKPIKTGPSLVDYAKALARLLTVAPGKAIELSKLSDSPVRLLRRLNKLEPQDRAVVADNLQLLMQISPAQFPLVRMFVQRWTMQHMDPHVASIIEFVAPFTLTQWENLQSLCESIRYLSENSIAGAIVECGVWKGGSMMAAAQMLAHMGDMTRKIYLCDTFQGMSEPSDHDIELHSGKTADELLGDRSKNESYMAYASLEEVKNNMDRCAYPKDLITYVKGPVEETLENLDTGPIALLRLDTDWYESTACELEQLFPRLVDHGILIIDDYGHFAGAKKAVDEFVAKQGKPIFLHRIDYSARLIVKTSGLSQTGRPD